MSSVAVIGILGLFAFLVYRGIVNKSGSVCGRGWVAFLMLPIAAAVMYTLFRSAVYGGGLSTSAPAQSAPVRQQQGKVQFSPTRPMVPVGKGVNIPLSRKGVTQAGKQVLQTGKQTIQSGKQALQTGKATVQALKSAKNLTGLAKTYAPGLKSLKGGSLGGNVERTKSLVGYAIFLAFIQYLISAVIIMAQKPTAPKTEVFKKSFVAAGISMIFSMIFIVAVTVVANVIPVVKGIMTIATRLPFIGSFINQNFFFTMATSPLNLLGALAAHGIACSLVKEPPKQ
jgi:hypothetical protein